MLVNESIDFNMSDVYRARLQLVQGSNPLRFELIQAEKLTENFRGDNASFNQITGLSENSKELRKTKNQQRHIKKSQN